MGKTITPVLNEGVVARCALRLALSTITLVVALAVGVRFAGANGSDLPPQIAVQGFVKPDDGRLELLVRIPLVLLGGFGLPKRGPGYLDLAQIEDRLREAAAATARQIEFFEDGRRLTPTLGEQRIALLSDRSFQSYATARAHLEGPRLPNDTDLYWNQGYFDAELEYSITSPRADFSVRVNIAPELGRRIKLHLQFLSISGPTRIYELPGSSRRVPLDPRWYEAAWTFAQNGFIVPFAVDRLVFLLCLAAPFRQFWSLLAVVMAMTAVQGATLTASALGATPDWRLLMPLLEKCLAAGVVFLVIENIVAPSLRRRWLIASVIGVLSGFEFGHLLVDNRQFAGAHAVVSAVSFNLAVALSEVVALVFALGALSILFTYVTGRRLGMVVLSIVLGHVAWHWMMDSSHRFELGASALVSTGSVAVVAWWILVGLLVGGVAWFLPQRFDARAEESAT